ncbi:MAG: hypothetical protein QXL96_10520 [Ignisphaera sp.]
MTIRRGDLSAPVLAIIVTIGVIAAGLVLMSWFWWFAPSLGRMGVLVVVGQPVLINSTKQTVEQYNLTIVLKNIGNTEVQIEGIVIKDIACIISSSKVIAPGRTVVLKNIQCQGLDLSKDEYIVEGIIISDAGTIRFSANVI